MSDLLPAPSDPGYQLAGPMDVSAAPASGFPVQKLLAFLRRFWWVPVITLTLALGAAASYYFWWMPPTFVSSSSMWETEKLRLPEGALFTEDPQSYLGTQTELLKSGRLEGLALARLQASGTNAVPLDKEGKPLKVKLKVTQVPKSTIFLVTASSSNPAYARAFLDALMSEYMEFKRTIRKTVSGDTLASISEQAQRLERDLKADQDALTLFQRSNNLAALQEEGTISGSYLTRLKTQLSDYQLEAQLLEATALEQEADASGKTNTVSSLLESLRGNDSAAASPAATARQTAVKELEMLKIQREKLSKYLRPKHPKIVKLDEQIDQGQKIVAMYRNQSREQLATARAALKIRIDSVQGSINGWETKVTAANLRIAEGEHLKLNVARAQSLYDRLVSLLQNVDISRNIDQETLTIMQPASMAERSYRLELILLALAVFGGSGLGVGIVFLIAVRDDRFTSIVEVNDKFGDGMVGQVPDMPLVAGRAPLLLEEGEERHIYAESYRSLRSALLFLAVEGERPKIVLITSALPGEGKSTVAANLAKTMAMGGARVLLVDGDLRKGVLHELLGLQREPGLSDLLQTTRPQDHRPQTVVSSPAVSGQLSVVRGQSSVVPPGGPVVSSPVVPGPSAPLQPSAFSLEPSPEGPSAPLEPSAFSLQPSPEGPAAPLEPSAFSLQPSPEGPSAPLEPSAFSLHPSPKGPSAPLEPSAFSLQPSPEGPSAPLEPSAFSLHPSPEGPSAPLQPSAFSLEPSPDAFIQNNSLPNLFFLSSGKRLSNPGDLFLGGAFDKLLARWREQYDYVFIDTSPVFAADDATTLAPKVDGTLFVVRNRYSGARQVREALELLYQRQARVLGLVYNRADATAKSYHYYKYAQYYPGQGTADHGTTDH